MKMMKNRRWQPQSPWHEIPMGTMPTATVTGHLLCQAWFSSLDSSLVLTTTLGSVHHHCPPLPVLLLEITVNRSQQFSWKLSSGSHHTLPLWWRPGVTLVPGQRLLSPGLHATQHRRVSMNSTGSQETDPQAPLPHPPPTPSGSLGTSTIVMKPTMPCVCHL